MADIPLSAHLKPVARVSVDEAPPENPAVPIHGNSSVRATLTSSKDVPEQVPMQIGYDDFRKVEMLVGQIVSAKPQPKTDKLVHMIVDFGERGAKVVLAGILKSFPDPGVLLGKRCAFVVNLTPRKIAGIESQAMLLAGSDGGDEGKVVLVEVPGAQVGSRLG